MLKNFVYYSDLLLGQQTLLNYRLPDFFNSEVRHLMIDVISLHLKFIYVHHVNVGQWVVI